MGYEKGYSFPLIQLPRKSEAGRSDLLEKGATNRVSINSTSEEVRSIWDKENERTITFEVSINSTSEEVRSILRFVVGLILVVFVSINSTSEEVRSLNGYNEGPEQTKVSINSTSEEVRRSV